MTMPDQQMVVRSDEQMVVRNNAERQSREVQVAGWPPSHEATAGQGAPQRDVPLSG
jgi:hypothetical protein